MESVQSSLVLSDLFIIVTKAFVFGAIVAIFGCSWGLTTTGGVKGRRAFRDVRSGDNLGINFRGQFFPVFSTIS